MLPVQITLIDLPLNFPSNNLPLPFGVRHVKITGSPSRDLRTVSGIGVVSGVIEGSFPNGTIAGKSANWPARGHPDRRSSN